MDKMFCHSKDRLRYVGRFIDCWYTSIYLGMQLQPVVDESYELVYQ